jgi:hypothetical protein
MYIPKLAIAQNNSSAEVITSTMVSEENEVFVNLTVSVIVRIPIQYVELDYACCLSPAV